MNLQASMGYIALLLGTAFTLTACAPEVGSEAWCKKMEETPKGDWSANMAADYAKFCVFKMDNK